MADTWEARTELLVGPDQMELIHQAEILLVGAGGVGGYAAEMLVRSGIQHLTLIDMDAVQETNINRQIIALHSTIGKPKVEVWRERLLDINPRLELHAQQIFLRDELTEELLASKPFTFVIDAIDTLSPKVHLIKSLVERKTPFISIMGMGAQFDPRLITIGRMDKAKNCSLARFIRKRLRKLGVPLKFPVVYSTELADDAAIELVEGEANKKSITGTIAHNPAVAGCYAAYTALDYITGRGSITI